MHRTAAEDARADERVRIHIGVTEELIAVAVHPGDGTDGEAAERRRLGVDLVGEHPQVPGAQAPVFAGLQAQHRDTARERLGTRQLGFVRHRSAPGVPPV
jgi:hypothetical protein